MSVSVNIELCGPHNADRYVEVLSSEFGTAKHPDQENTYVVEQHLFYAPRPVDDHISVLSFNNTPLPDAQIEALVVYPELSPDDLPLRWMQEQDLIFEATLGHLEEKVGQVARRREDMR